MSKVRCLVIGLDGATFSLIDPLCGQGRLPKTRQLINEGVRGVLKSTVLPISEVAWTSFATGKNPGKHGVFDFSKRRPNSYEDLPVSSKDVRAEPLWDILSRHGKKVGLVNVPATYPPRKVNGVMITGFPTPEEKGDYTYPRELLHELRAKFPGYRLQPQTPLFEGNEEALAEDIAIVTENIVQTTLHLLEKGDWDFLMTVFTGTDAMGHIFWNYVYPSHSSHDEKKAAKLGELFSGTYSMIDKGIERIMNSIDQSENALIISDHGFAGVDKAVYINNWLLKAGLLQIKKTIPSQIRFGAFRLGFTPVRAFELAKRLHLVRGSGISESPESWTHFLMRHLFLSRGDIDWRASKAYSFGNFGQVYVNLAGKDPEGIVTQGEYDDLVSRIVRDLGQMKDDSTGEPVFDMIFRRNQIYWGPASHLSPDVVFINSKSKYVAVRYLEFGHNELLARHPVWTGAHAMDGISIAWGKDVARGVKTSSASIMDIAPTVLHLLGCPIPKDMDGQVLYRIFSDGSEVKARPVVYEENGFDAIKRLKTAGRI